MHSHFTRRQFIESALTLAATLPLSGLARAAEGSAGTGSATGATLDAKVVAKLAKSPFVYISPLRSDGQESTCHGELWFAWLDDAVVVTVASDRWKARAVGQGLDAARIWVGNYGRWKTMGVTSDEFREGPSFRAKAELSKDTALNERLLAEYDRKYPAEIARWCDKMRAGLEDGSRTLIRYVPAVG